MSFRSLPCLLATAAFLALPGLCLAQESQSAKPAAPAKEAPAAAPRVQQNGLKNLENDLFRPFKGLSPDSSLDAVLSAPSQPPPQARPQDERRLRELREKRQREKDWVFMNPEEGKDSQSFEEMFNLPTTKDKNSKNQKKMSPVEQYYRRALGLETADEDNLFAPRDRKKSNKKPLYDLKGSSSQDAGERDEENDSGLSPALRETKRSLKALADDRLDAKENSAWNGKGFFSDVFGLGQPLPTPAEIEAKRIQEERLNDFRKILGVPAVTSPAGSLDPLAGLRPSTSIPGSAVSLPGVSTAIKSAVPNVQFGAIGGLGNVFNAPQNESAPAALANPVPAPVVQPRVVLPKAPDFSAPQRRF